VLRADGAQGDREGMWEGREDKDEDDEDSEGEEDEDEDEESSDGEESDGMGGTMSKAATTSTSASTSTVTTGQPSNKFAITAQDIAREEQEQKKAAKRALKASKKSSNTNKKAAAGSDDSESDSDDSEEDDLLQAGTANRNINKAMKASSLNDAPKRPVAQGMNRKERCVRVLSSALSSLPLTHCFAFLFSSCNIHSCTQRRTSKEGSKGTLSRSYAGG